MNMKNSRIIIPAFAVLLLCAAVVSVVHFSSSAAPEASSSAPIQVSSSKEDSWELSNELINSIPDDMTLGEALERYPEIRQLFGIWQVSDEEARQGIEMGTDVINANDFNAKDFLSNLNYRQNQQ